MLLSIYRYGMLMVTELDVLRWSIVIGYMMHMRQLRPLWFQKLHEVLQDKFVVNIPTVQKIKQSVSSNIIRHIGELATMLLVALPNSSETIKRYSANKIHATRPQLKPIRNFPHPVFSNSKYWRRVRYQHTKTQKSFGKRFINALLKIHNCIIQVWAYRTQHMKWLHPSIQCNITEHTPSWSLTAVIDSIRHRLEKRKKQQYMWCGGRNRSRTDICTPAFQETGQNGSAAVKSKEAYYTCCTQLINSQNTTMLKVPHT